MTTETHPSPAGATDGGLSLMSLPDAVIAGLWPRHLVLEGFCVGSRALASALSLRRSLFVRGATPGGGDGGARLPETITFMRALRWLSINDSVLPEPWSVLAMNAIGGATTLSALELQNVGVSSAAWDALAASMGQLGNLGTLTLTGSGTACDAVRRVLPSVARACSLRHLCLCRGHAELGEGIDFSGLTNLETLHLQEIEFLTGSAGLLGVTSLRVLRMIDNGIDRAGMLGIEEALKGMPSLVDLVLSNMGIDDRAWGGFAESLSRAESIRALDLSLNTMNREGGLSMARALGGMTRLTSLDLTNVDMDPPMCTALASSLVSLTALQELALSDNHLNFPRALEIARPLRSLAELRSLEMRNAGLNCILAYMFVSVIRDMPQLATLDMGGNLVEDWGATHMAGVLVGMTQLRTLRFKGNRCGEEGIQALRSALTGLAKLSI